MQVEVADYLAKSTPLEIDAATESVKCRAIRGRNSHIGVDYEHALASRVENFF